MRFLFIAATLTFASVSAASAAVTLSPVSYSAEFQAALEENYGVREGEVLGRAVTDAVSDALTRRGARVDGDDGVTIELSIIGAQPNRPTFHQLTSNGSLDPMRSISTGGAELRAVLRQNGGVVAEVTHRHYSSSLRELNGGEGTWTEARRVILRFARKVADAYAASAAH